MSTVEGLTPPGPPGPLDPPCSSQQTAQRRGMRTYEKRPEGEVTNAAGMFFCSLWAAPTHRATLHPPGTPTRPTHTKDSDHMCPIDIHKGPHVPLAAPRRLVARLTYDVLHGLPHDRCPLQRMGSRTPCRMASPGSSPSPRLRASSSTRSRASRAIEASSRQGSSMLPVGLCGQLT